MVLQWLYQRLINRHHMMLIPVQNIIHIIPAFHLITPDSAAELHMVLCLDKQLQVDLPLNLLKILDE
jgi:hypothetical protein